MNLRLIGRLLSFILGALAGAFLFCAWVAFMLEEDSGGPLTATGFLHSSGILFLGTLVLRLISRHHDGKLFRREALTVIGLGWIAASLAGALPYWLIVPNLRLTDAIFESCSGLTTTGASIFSDIEALPAGILFWRSLSQWIGGLGVVVLIVALLNFLGAGGKILFSRESSAQAADLHSARVQTGVFRLLAFYLMLSLICMLVYKALGMNWFEAVCHMFATVSTGGFSTRNTSIAAFPDPLLQWSITFFMVVGGTSFVILLRLIRREKNLIGQLGEIKAYFGILVGATLLVAGQLLFVARYGVEEAFRHAAFQVTSIMTTTGFATDDFDLWLPSAHLVLLSLMIIGGCSGSTSGGTKVIRFVTAMQICRSQIEKSYRAHVVRPLRLNGQVISAEEQQSVTGFLILAALTVLASTLIVAVLEPALSLTGVISATLATLFNIGPGLAEVGPTQNFAFFHDGTKIFFSLLMILGRLEFYALLVLFSPTLWKRY